MRYKKKIMNLSYPWVIACLIGSRSKLTFPEDQKNRCGDWSAVTSHDYGHEESLIGLIPQTHPSSSLLSC